MINNLASIFQVRFFLGYWKSYKENIRRLLLLIRIQKYSRNSLLCFSLEKFIWMLDKTMSFPMANAELELEFEPMTLRLRVFIDALHWLSWPGEMLKACLIQLFDGCVYSSVILELRTNVTDRLLSYNVNLNR